MPSFDTAIKPTGGLIGREVDSSILSKAYFPDMKNIMKYGDYFGQRPGRTAYGSASGIVMAYNHFKIGDYNKFMKFTSTGIYTRSSTGWDDVTGAALTGGIDNLIDSCTVYDATTGTPYVVFTNGKDNIRKYTGAGNTSDMSAWTSYKARFVRYYNGYLIAFHLTDAGTRFGFRFRCSNTDFPNDTTGTNSKTFNLTKDRNLSDIMRVEYFNDYLAIYKTDCIYLMWLGNTKNIFQFDVAVHKTGLRASRGLALYKGGAHFFLGYDDVYFWASPNSKPAGLTTRKIKQRLFNDTSPSNLSRAIMIYDEMFEKIKLYVPEGEYLNRVYSLDLTEEAWSWWVEERSDITAVGTYLQDSIVTIDELTGIYGTIDDMTGIQIDELSGTLQGNFPILIEGDKDGKSWYEDGDAYNDGNITIKSEIETQDTIFETSGVPFSSDRSMGIRFEAKGAQSSGDLVYIYYSTDEGKTWAQIEAGIKLADYSTWTSFIPLTNEWAFYEAHIDVQSRKIRYKFANDQGNSTFFIQKLAPIIEDGDPQ